MGGETHVVVGDLQDLIRHQGKAVQLFTLPRPQVSGHFGKIPLASNDSLQQPGTTQNSYILLTEVREAQHLAPVNLPS